MTFAQKAAKRAALERAAVAPNKRWLGRSILLTGIQSAWIRSLLSVWGESVKGGTAPRTPKGHACWHLLKNQRWSDTALQRFTEALDQARKEGFMGEYALKRAQVILWPKPQPNLLDEALTNDDADFIESCVLSAFAIKDPVYIIGVGYYTTRKKISELTRELRQIAPWLNENEARKRVRWCIEIFQARVFLVARQRIMAE